ncbi:MAG: LEA type 2 family protein [Bacteroidota bacterium]
MKNTFAFLLFIYSLMLSACSKYQNPDFRSIENIKFKTATLAGDVVLVGDMILYNPNTIGVNVDEMALEVFVDDSKVADVVQNVRAKMKAKSDFSLPLEVNIPMKEVFDELKGGLLSNLLKSQKADVKIEGTVGVSIAGISRSVPFSYEERMTIGGLFGSSQMK